MKLTVFMVALVWAGNCVSNVPCNVTFAYVGPVTVCNVVRVVTSHLSDGTLVADAAVVNTGTFFLTTTADDDVSTFVLDISCDDEPTVAATAPFAASYTAFPTLNPTTSEPSAAPSTTCGARVQYLVTSACTCRTFGRGVARGGIERLVLSTTTT